MRSFATIRHRPTCIRGSPHSGWGGATSSEPGAKTLPFRFDIADDGAGGYLLAYASEDDAYVADSSHASLDAAYRAAEEQFGVLRSEWHVGGGG